MSKLVDSSRIEGIVGVQRHDTEHWARAVSAEQTVYILHSRRCLESGRDLRRCLFSLAMDRGIDPAAWPQDQPVRAAVHDGLLVPFGGCPTGNGAA